MLKRLCFKIITVNSKRLLIVDLERVVSVIFPAVEFDLPPISSSTIPLPVPITSDRSVSRLVSN